MAHLEAAALGMPDLSVLVIPHPFGDLRDDAVQAVADRIAPLVREALTATMARSDYRDPMLALP